MVIVRGVASPIGEVCCLQLPKAKRRQDIIEEKWQQPGPTPLGFLTNDVRQYRNLRPRDDDCRWSI